eukprot:11189019-Lingulodinium_polyedra.AAC.1
MHWKKPTSFAIAHLPALQPDLLCTRDHVHQQLRGSGPGGRSWTSIAEPYPWGLSRCLALACCLQAGWGSQSRRLDCAECARCARRVGEASHPGPARASSAPARAAARAHGPDLRTVERVERQTAELGAYEIARFVVWLKSAGAASLGGRLAQAPPLLDALLREFGVQLYY